MVSGLLLNETKTMNKTKVSITKTYTIDLYTKANDTQEDIYKTAETYLNSQILSGTEHYYQTNETEYILFDVTNTDDPFDPLNS